MAATPLRASTSSAADTQDLAATIAQLSRAGDVLVLVGEMGAGKTAFAQGFARGLGITEQVTSPTFTIVREYEGGRLALHHLDVYRLDQMREVSELGVSEMLDERAVMLVEWGDAVLPVLGDQYLEVRIGFGEDDDDRVLELSCKGNGWQARHGAVAESLGRWTSSSDGGGEPC